METRGRFLRFIHTKGKSYKNIKTHYQGFPFVSQNVQKLSGMVKEVKLRHGDGSFVRVKDTAHLPQIKNPNFNKIVAIYFQNDIILPREN